MGKIARYLNQLTVGNVFDTPEILDAYSIDRSILKITPKAVAFPESTEDVQKLMRFCSQLAAKDIKIPVTVRGSGLDEMGADISNGLIISTEKLNNLLEADRRERLVRVQAGITLKELNTALSVNGLTIPVAGHDFETIGGLISNNPVDDYASKYGGIYRYVERIEVVLPNGECLQTSRVGKHTLEKRAHEKNLEGDIYRKLPKVLKNNSKLLREIKENPGRAGLSGLASIKHRDSIDLKTLFFGAEGTLGVITEVILCAVPIERHDYRVAATFRDFEVAQKFLDFAKDLKPCELNIYDIDIIKTAEESGKQLSDITKKMDDGGYVVFMRFNKRQKLNIHKILGMKKKLPRSTRIFAETEKGDSHLGELENSLASFMNYVKDGERVPLLTDFQIPAEKLKDFLADIKILEEKLGLDLAIFGSYQNSIYNLRPKFNLEDENFNKKAVAFLRAGAFIIKRCGGSIVGGGPEGRVKAIVTNSELSSEEKELYAKVKSIFDRYDIMNPGIKTSADARSTLKHFRTTSSTKIMI